MIANDIDQKTVTLFRVWSEFSLGTLVLKNLNVFTLDSLSTLEISFDLQADKSSSG